MTIDRLTPEDIRAFEPEAKIGLLATVSPEGEPHLSLITTLRAKSPTRLMWGQFCEGRSKDHVKQDPKAAFLVMNLERELWRGKATWTHCATSGDDYVLFNQQPMFRYNAYFGIHTVHYMDLVELTDRRKLFLPAVVAGALAATVGGKAGSLGRGSEAAALKPWAVRHLSNPGTLKFLAAVGDDGYPVILPIVPAHPIGAGSVLVGPLSKAGLRELPEGRRVALFALSLEMESVLLRGTLTKLGLVGDGHAAKLEIDWVYNSMPPLPGQIYPELPLTRYDPREDNTQG